METPTKSKQYKNKKQKKRLKPLQIKALEAMIELYGDTKIELDYESDFQLLIAVILSAQTTDKQVNKVTPALFAKVREPEDMKKISLEEIENHIQYINFFRNKSRFVKETGILLADKYGGKIPNNLQEMQKLPGVGIKTAKVVLSVLYDMPYIGVDTHIHRVANRMKIVKTKTPEQTDKILDALLPIDLKKRIHHPMVLFGRYHCQAKNPACKDWTEKGIINYISSLGDSARPTPKKKKK